MLNIVLIHILIIDNNDASPFVKLNFANCKTIGWKCSNDDPSDSVYSCAASNKTVSLLESMKSKSLYYRIYFYCRTSTYS